ncbi:CaiB/BaiF CoA transferase family protein [Streptomyces tubercidicus]|uniref:CaiB/BaiF CoA transferase family protein n=1 Tax=Streptomyces tubercidicus TaxID=47759 RepID=UPI0030DE03D5
MRSTHVPQPHPQPPRPQPRPPADATPARADAAVTDPAGTEPPTPPPARALDGILVADFSRVLAGPPAAATLADLGAEVIKVERPGTGDDTRAWGPPFATDRTAAYFDAANRSKRGLALDLGDPDDAAAARELARRADVLIENFRPGSLARYGLDHTTTLAANPGLVHCTITGRTGQGQLVEVNLLSSLLGSLVNQASGYLATGRDPGPMGNRHPSTAPYETLSCRDGQLLAVAVGNDRQFRELARVLGAPELAEDLRFARNEDRVRNRTDLIKALEDRLASDTPHGWTGRLSAASVPCGPVNTVSEALELAARLGLDPVTPVGEGRIPQVTGPLRLSGTPVAQPFAPPRLDEHGTALRTWLSGAADDPPATANVTLVTRRPYPQPNPPARAV